jgi:hypothetical protein
MRFRLGLITGLVLGYYFGAKAGRARYEQMRTWLRQAKDSEIAHVAADKAHEVAEVAKDKVVDVVDHTNNGLDGETVAERVELYVAPDEPAPLAL